MSFETFCPSLWLTRISLSLLMAVLWREEEPSEIRYKDESTGCFWFSMDGWMDGCRSFDLRRKKEMEIVQDSSLSQKFPRSIIKKNSLACENKIAFFPCTYPPFKSNHFCKRCFHQRNPSGWYLLYWVTTCFFGWKWVSFTRAFSFENEMFCKAFKNEKGFHSRLVRNLIFALAFIFFNFVQGWKTRLNKRQGRSRLGRNKRSET